MNFSTLLDYLYANSLPVVDSQRPTTNQPGTITIGKDIAVFVKEDSAQVVDLSGEHTRVSDHIASYIGVVAKVKSLLPTRGTGNVLTDGWA